jgi:hypothetical protein
MNNDDEPSGRRESRRNYIRPASSSLMRAPSWNPGIGAHSSDDNADFQDDTDDPHTAPDLADRTPSGTDIITSTPKDNDQSGSRGAPVEADPETMRQIRLRIEFEIPTVYLNRKNNSSASSFHVYQMHIKTGANARWSIFKRYSEFLDFHHQLSLIEPTVKGVPFPPKKRINSKASTIVQDRRRKLEEYIRKVGNIISSLPVVAADIEIFQNLISLVNDSDSSSTTQQVAAELAEGGSLSESQHSEQEQEREQDIQEQETKSTSDKKPVMSARCLFYKFITPNSSQDQTTV